MDSELFNVTLFCFCYTIAQSTSGVEENSDADISKSSEGEIRLIDLDINLETTTIPLQSYKI